ncbi:helix-turn-helix transcriptional regulator [Allokutzneria oryzae]|uniref:Helix-turn-helix transcriptional regulator n=1 Tax=Allokutzneria oryzae TaxID=1378989 RepID=A0ABV5ZQW6_9PSEU
MPHPTTRLLAMLELLQANHRLPGKDLAERLGVDERTVRRYASRLAEFGVPVEAERGRYGGYRLRPGYKLPPLMLTDDEAVAVTLGLVASKRIGLATTEPAVNSALAKIQRVLPPALRDRTQAVQEALGFTLLPRESKAPATDTVLLLGEAVRRRTRVRLRYRSWQDEESERELDPYGLVFHSGRWYVTGHDYRRGDLRTFRLDRVRSVSLQDNTFEAPADFDAVAHVTRSLARVPYTWEVEVVVEGPLDAVRRRIPPTTGTVAEVDGVVLLRTRAEKLDGMARMLAGFEWPFVVRKPTELRAALLDFTRHLAAQATRDES